jgi:hypothetical protein
MQNECRSEAGLGNKALSTHMSHLKQMGKMAGYGIITCSKIYHFPGGYHDDIYVFKGLNVMAFSCRERNNSTATGCLSIKICTEINF